MNSNEVKVKTEVIAASRVTKVEFFINGILKDELTSRPYERIFTLQDGVYAIKVKAQDEKGNQVESEVKIGVNVPWDWSPTTTPTLSPTPTP